MHNRSISHHFLQKPMKLNTIDLLLYNNLLHLPAWPRSTMDSIRVSEAPDTGSIPVEATISTWGKW